MLFSAGFFCLSNGGQVSLQILLQALCSFASVVVLGKCGDIEWRDLY